MKAKIRFIILLALTFSTFMFTDIVAQNIIYEVSGINTNNTIIREYLGKDIYIIYTDDGAKQQFVYFNPTLTNAVVADFTGAKMQVNDMEIVDDLLYFCGKSSNGAAFGYFEIPSVFSGTGSFYVNYTIPYGIGVNVTEYLKEYKRLEVQGITSTDIHIYMIAEAYNTSGSIVSNDYRCVVDAWDQGTMYGTAYTHEQFSGVYFFNDLAVTDRELVVVGDKHDATGQYMHSYPLPLPMTPTIFPPLGSMITYWYVPDLQFYPEPEIQIEHIDGSVFAVTSRGTINSTYDGLSVTTYNGVGFPADRILINDPYITKQVRDIRYNPQTHRLLVLPNWQYTGKKNSLYSIELSPTYAMTSVVMETPNIPYLHSLDISPSREVFSSGLSLGNDLQVWGRLFPMIHVPHM